MINYFGILIKGTINNLCITFICLHFSLCACILSTLLLNVSRQVLQRTICSCNRFPVVSVELTRVKLFLIISCFLPLKGLLPPQTLLDIILILSNLEIIWKSTNKQAKFSVGIFENFSTNCEITKSVKIDESLIVQNFLTSPFKTSTSQHWTSTSQW